MYTSIHIQWTPSPFSWVLCKLTQAAVRVLFDDSRNRHHVSAMYTPLQFMNPRGQGIPDTSNGG
eukprot:m.965745 g.965745  ORF g.965745 m.965745 type:complete len:64 (-) comp23911_c0_seq2:1285-1476(-)